MDCGNTWSLAICFGFAIPLWGLGACIAAQAVEPLGRRKVVVATYGLTAPSLAIICALPGWVLGLPAIAPWLYWVGDVLCVLAVTVLGWSALNNLSRGVRRAAVSATIHVILSVLILLLPVIGTVWASEAAFRKAVAIQSVQPQLCPPGPPVEFVQLSDLHIVLERTKTRDGSTPGNDRLSKVLQRVQQLQPEFLFITGDMTDGGGEPEWAFVRSHLEPIAAHSKVIMSPGNHDLNVVFTVSDSDPSIEPDDVNKVRRFFSAQSVLYSSVQSFDGTPVNRVVQDAPPEPDGKEMQQAQRDFFGCSADCVTEAQAGDPASSRMMAANCRLACAAEKAKSPAYQELRRVDDYWYNESRNALPLKVTDGSRIVIVLGTTFTAPDIVGRNALGEIQGQQLDQFRQLLVSLPLDTREVFILAHHPFTRPTDEKLVIPYTVSYPAWQNSMLFAYSLLGFDAEQASSIVQTIREAAARTHATFYVLFGHRHMKSLGQSEHVTFVESPNIGTEESSWQGFFAKTPQSSSVVWCSVN
jgi:3',5'-cyclic AMP phosphodiesterase CpdA